MDLDRFIKQDIIEFLGKEQEKDIAVKGVRADEMTLFDIDKDYAKLLDEQLKVNNIQSAKDLFDELRNIYNRTSERYPLRKKMFIILKDMYRSLAAYLGTHQADTALDHEFRHYAGVFSSDMLPKKILSELEGVQNVVGGEQSAGDESFNLLQDSVFKSREVKQEEDLTKNIAEIMAREIASAIPLEESKELSSIFGGRADSREIFFVDGGTSPDSPPPVRPPSLPSMQESDQAKGAAPKASSGNPSVFHQTVGAQAIGQQSVQQQAVGSHPYPKDTRVVGGVSKEELRSMMEDVTRELMGRQGPSSAPPLDAPRQENAARPSGQAAPELRFTSTNMVPERGGAALPRMNVEAGLPEFTIQGKKEEVRDIRSNEAASLQLADRRIGMMLEEKARIEKERMNLQEQDSLVRAKVDEIKSLKLDPEEIELIGQKEAKEAELSFVTTIAQAKKDIYRLLLKKDIIGAKEAYLKIREAYDSLPSSTLKKEMHKDLVGVYDQIAMATRSVGKDVAKAAREVPAEDGKTTKAILAHLKAILISVKSGVIRGDIVRARRDLAEALELAAGITDQAMRRHAITIIESYQARLGSIPPKPEVHQEDLYKKGLRLLYGRQKKEAAEVFREILMKSPDNTAARMRLREAEAG